MTGPIGAPEDATPLDADELEFARRTPRLWERRLIATVDARDAEIKSLKAAVYRAQEMQSIMTLGRDHAMESIVEREKVQRARAEKAEAELEKLKKPTQSVYEMVMARKQQEKSPSNK